MTQMLVVLRDILRREHKKVFEETWSLLAGGVLIGLMSIVTFVWARPWGVVGGIRNWGDWFFYWIGLYEARPASALTSGSSVLAIGLLWGALIAALMAKQLAFRVPPRLELIKGLVGGVLLGIGAALAGGCNVGGFYSAIGALSLSGFTMMTGLLLGAYVGLKYLYWELEHLPGGNSSGMQASTSNGSRTQWQPMVGLGLILGAYWAKELYSLHGHIIAGGLLLCGISFGFILHRSRFCFARCFREPFMTGDPVATQAVIISLLICVVGFAVIKWTGVRNAFTFTSSSFGLGGLLGGFIFGFGMLLTGGCGSGTIWRAAEGQLKLVGALASYALSASLTKSLIRSSESLQALLGWKVFLPDLFGYPLAVASIYMVLLIWYLAVSWNEETERFVIQM